MWVVSGWKTVKRAAALRQNFIALLAYIHEPYSSSGSAESLPLRLCGFFRIRAMDIIPVH